MRAVAAAVVSMMVLVASGVAQVPKANVFLGYSYLSQDLANTSTRQSLNGWEGSIEGKVLPFIGIVGDFSGHYGTTQFFACPGGVPGGGCTGAASGTLHTALFGPRVSASFHGVRPFAHVLVGGAFLSGADSDVSLASAFGGGADFRLAPILGWRVQADYIHTHFSGTPAGYARVSTGVVLRF